MKKCPRCKYNKQESEFHKSRKRKGGLAWCCKVCVKAFAASWYLRNKEYSNARNKAWYEKNFEKISQRARIELTYEQRRNARLKNKFGITASEYDRILGQQNFLCAVCSQHRDEFSKAFAVDHCHTTGRIRGLLCEKCNQGIGCFNDSPERIRLAVQYLEVSYENSL